MISAAVCPRCHGELIAPDLMHSGWRCDRHGEVAPFRLGAPSGPWLQSVTESSRVPVWFPARMPAGWLVSGLGLAADHVRSCAAVVGLSGPAPLGGPADLAIVAEEPQVGLGARYAGLSHLDPGDVTRAASEVQVRIDGHRVRLWEVAGTPADRVALVGEAEGLWLWLVFWPDSADLLLAEQLHLTDARTGAPPECDFGALTPRLLAA